MTSVTDADLAAALRRTVVAATRAPSVHNTQPWRLVLRPSSVDVVADWRRQLLVLDRRGRQLLISCGCAVLNARVALAAAGLAVSIDRFPDGAHPDVVARLEVRAGADVDERLGHLEPSIAERRTNRRRFDETAPVPQDVVDLLVLAARAEGADLVPVTRPDDRRTLARLSQLADRVENTDPAYRAELRAWTTDDLRRPDGVPAFAVPHVNGLAEDDLPMRDFDTRGIGWLPSHTHSSMNQCLLLLGTTSDSSAAWARAGEALERVLLELTALGYAASPLTQVIEVPQTHAELVQELRLGMHPHLLLRVGRAPATPVTRRRRLVDVLDDVR